MIYGSVCSGVSAAGMAWGPLGWRCSFLSETEPFPRAVLEQRFGAGTANGPTLYGDFTQIEGWEDGPIDLLVGGTPCQSFSIAGARGGLDDVRGNLALEFVRLARRAGARWFVWENVPGALSTDGGRAFGTILGEMVDRGYGVAWRVLDAQYFGLAQRRKRLFVVGHLGDWRGPAEVLFEPEGVRGHPPARGETAKEVAPAIGGSLAGRNVHAPDVSLCLNAGGMGRQDYETETLIAHALRGEGFDASEDGTGRGTPLTAGSGGVRRLTPRECERLQGFPDDHTAVSYRGKPASDGPRYKAIGNSMAVPVMRWIGERIEAADKRLDATPVSGRE